MNSYLLCYSTIYWVTNALKFHSICQQQFLFATQILFQFRSCRQCFQFGSTGRKNKSFSNALLVDQLNQEP